MNTVYELYNTRTRNLVGSYGSEGEALQVVRASESVNGPAYAERLMLTIEDEGGRTRQIASGRELVKRANQSDVNHALASQTMAEHV